MTISQDCIDLVKRREGFSPTPYVCPAGKWTVGFGHTDGVTADTPRITEEEASEMLAKELTRFAVRVERLVVRPLSQNQFDALVSFAYNVGMGNFASSTLLKKVNAGDMAGAADEFNRWVHGGGKVLPGLVRRRAAEKSLFMGTWA